MAPSPGGRNEPCSGLFETAPELPVGHAPIIFELLPACGMEIMFQNVFAKSLSQHLRIFHGGHCVAQGTRNFLQITRGIGITGEGWIQLQFLLDAIQPRRDLGGEGRAGDSGYRYLLHALTVSGEVGEMRTSRSRSVWKAGH